MGERAFVFQKWCLVKIAKALLVRSKNIWSGFGRNTWLKVLQDKNKGSTWLPLMKLLKYRKYPYLIFFNAKIPFLSFFFLFFSPIRTKTLPAKSPTEAKTYQTPKHPTLKLIFHPSHTICSGRQRSFSLSTLHLSYFCFFRKRGNHWFMLTCLA